MKNIYKIIGPFLLLLVFGACTENDKDPIASANGLLLNQPEAGNTFVLTPQTADVDLVTFTWNKSNNAVSAVPKYTIEIAKSGTSFASPLEAVADTDILTTESYTWKSGYLNSLLNQIGFDPCSSVDIDVRIKSTLGIVDGNALVQYSNPVTLQVTPYLLDLPLMAFSSSDVITESTGKMAASGILNTDYEGYMYLEPGTYKFYKASSCNLFDSATVYGDDNSGAFSNLVLNGDGYVVATAGLYLVRANLPASGDLTYSVRPVAWNVFGTGKSVLQLANVPMTYDPADGLLKLTITLKNGYGFKFRATGNQILLGKYQAASPGTSDFGGPLLSYVANTTTLASLPTNELAVPGLRNPPSTTSYDIVLDLRKPRDYTYSITATP